MALYKRPNGKIVEVNDTPGSYEYVEYLGWVRQSEPNKVAKSADTPLSGVKDPLSGVKDPLSGVKDPVSTPKKRKRRTKKQMAEDK